ncbi:MAG: PDZ domain-containing protein [Phycisphaerales bacterium JB043]
MSKTRIGSKRRSGRERAALALCVGLGALFLSGASLAQSGPLLDTSRVDVMLSALSSPDYATREEATELLMQNAVEVAPALRESLAMGGLTPEQRVRVLEVLERAFMQSPRAGLGVSFDQQNRGQGAMLETVLETFPVAKTLRAGDFVIEADGRRLTSLPNQRSTGMLRQAIISRDPGEYLPLRIMRDGEEFEAQIELGNFNDLNAPVIEYRELASAWEYRQRRLELRVADQTSEIDIGARWTPDRMRLVARPEGTSVLPGGRSALGSFRLIAQSVLREGTLRRIMQQEQQNARVRIDPDDDGLDRELIFSRMSQLRDELSALQHLLGDRSLTEAERRSVSQQIMRLESQLRELRRQIDEIPR